MSGADPELRAFEDALTALVECQTVLESLASNVSPDGQARASIEAASGRVELAATSLSADGWQFNTLGGA